MTERSQHIIGGHHSVKFIDTGHASEETEGEDTNNVVGRLGEVDDLLVELPNLAFTALLAVVLVGGVVVLNVKKRNKNENTTLETLKE